jgi:hypothetical protein
VLLGRHVRGRADGAVDLGEPRQRTGAAQDRDAEVEHLHQPAVDDHDVGGLDVAVHTSTRWTPASTAAICAPIAAAHATGGVASPSYTAPSSKVSSVEPRSSCMTSQTCSVPSGCCSVPVS